MSVPRTDQVWLKQLAGEWSMSAEAVMLSDQPPLKSNATESVHVLGGFWIIAEGTPHLKDVPINGVMTLGYDPPKSQYDGTWVDSRSNHLWKYEGVVDESGKTLVLPRTGPSMMASGQTFTAKRSRSWTMTTK